MPKTTEKKALTIDEVKAKLTEFGVEFPDDAPEADLVELLGTTITSINEKNTKAALEDEPSESTETVTIPKSDWEKIVQRVADLEAGKDPVTDEDPRIAKRKAAALRARKKVRVRFIEGKMVVGYGKSWNVMDANARPRLQVMVKMEDKTEVQQDAIDFFSYGKFVEGEVTNREELDPIIIDQGVVNKTKLNYDKYSSEKTDEEVALEVVIPQYLYHITLPDGKQVELPPEALN